MIRPLVVLAAAGLLETALFTPTCPRPVERDRVELPGLSARVRVSTDEFGVPHVQARSWADAVRVQGYLHARDRFFQMDWNRRAANGRLAELSGRITDVVADARARTIGLSAAAQRSLDALEPDERALLDAYAEGVNAWLASHPLPDQYQQLEVSVVPPWSALDTLTVLKASFAQNTDLLSEITETAVLQHYVDVLGEERAALFYPAEIGRFAPWAPYATVPDALGTSLSAARAPGLPAARGLGSAGRLAQRVRSTGLLGSTPDLQATGRGSNAFGVAARHSATCGPLVAGDPHVALTAPSGYYEIHLVIHDPVLGPANLAGISQPGGPGIFLGQSAHVAWAQTSSYPDQADVFRDRLLRDDPGCPVRLCIDSAGDLHPVEERSETYLLNLIGDGVADNTQDLTSGMAALAPQAVHVLSVPFRSFGPVVEVTDRGVLAEGGVAETDVLTLQWIGLHEDRFARYLLDAMRARDVFEFAEALRWRTFPGHFVVADTQGNLAYFASGEVPLRADLEAGAVAGAPPWLVRDGAGAANWVPDPARSQGQVLPFAVLPREEMPHVVNPPAGFVVNANEDASGFILDNDFLNQLRPSKPQAIHYLGDMGGLYSATGLRNGRITDLLREKIDAGERISIDDMMRMQADTQALHVEFLLPHLRAAFESAKRPEAPGLLGSLAADPRIVEAMARLAAWDHSHPTGIPEGYDASDADGVRTSEVSEAEVQASIAATLYEVWVIKLSKRFDAHLTSLGLTAPGQTFPHGRFYNSIPWLLSQDPFTGVGASGIDYFPEPAELTDPRDRRDAVLLGLLRDVLDALPGPAYAEAFQGSTDQSDYRWGRLHRMALANPLGDSSASIPPAAGFAALEAQLPGLARDGTWESVNVAPGPGLPDSSSAWLTSWGAGFRSVHSPLRRSLSGSGMQGFSILAGGASGDPASPHYASQLGRWLTADYRPIPMTTRQVAAAAKRVELFEPVSP